MRYDSGFMSPGYIRRSLVGVGGERREEFLPGVEM